MMITMISREQILAKIGRFLDSGFGTPAPDKLTFVEIGSSKDYDRIHIKGAIYMTSEQIERAARSWLPSHGDEIVIYGNAANRDLCRFAAQSLSDQGYENVDLYLDGKEDWISSGLWTSFS